MFHSRNPCIDFNQIFRVCLLQEDLELIRFGGGGGGGGGQHFEYFWVLTFVGVPQPKPVHGFSPNFQDMLTETGSELSKFWRVSVTMQCFKYFSVLTS